MTQTDILIIGAGPGGAATALFLAKHGISSTLVDKTTFPRDKICGDALSGKVIEVLNKLDPTLINQLHTQSQEFLGSFGVTFIAPSGQSLRVPFKNEITETSPPPGFISRRVDFDNWLIEQVRKEPLIKLIERFPTGILLDIPTAEWICKYRRRDESRCSQQKETSPEKRI